MAAQTRDNTLRLSLPPVLITPSVPQTLINVGPLSSIGKHKNIDISLHCVRLDISPCISPIVQPGLAERYLMMVNKSGDATWGCCCFVVSETAPHWPTLADTDNKPKTVREEERKATDGDQS